MRELGIDISRHRSKHVNEGRRECMRITFDLHAGLAALLPIPDGRQPNELSAQKFASSGEFVGDLTGFSESVG